MITKTFGVDFNSGGGALTLHQDDVTEGDNYGYQSRTHEDGWTISGRVVEDYYVWVNEFEAVHPVFGKVWGDFQSEVFADSEEGFQDFYNKHEPNAWDYGDI